MSLVDELTLVLWDMTGRDPDDDSVLDFGDFIIPLTRPHEAAKLIVMAAAARGIELDLAYQWHRVEALLAPSGWDWRVRIEHHSSGDGHSEPVVESYRAIAESGHSYPQWARSTRGAMEASPALALSALADVLEARKMMQIVCVICGNEHAVHRVRRPTTPTIP